MKAIKALLEAFTRQGTDVYGFYHYIPKEVVDDATKEFHDLQRDLSERKTKGDLSR